MAYFAELRANWRPLTAVVIGLSSGLSVIGTITNIMAPHFMREFGWSREDFAYVNSLSIFTIMMLPVAGRLADMIGVRRTAMIGVITLPITFVLLSIMTGDIRQYIALYLVQSVFCITTTVTVYSRMVVQFIKNARGLALGIAGAAPAVTGLVGGPILNEFVLNYGWRVGYQALAAILLTTGVIALLMAPRERKAAVDVGASESRARRGWRDYPTIARHPAFWLLLVTLILVNVPQTIATAQFGLVMLDNGISSADVGFLVSGLMAGMLTGRLLCGVALDQLPPHLVAASSMVLPSIGLFLLGSDMDAFGIVLLAAILVGLAYGAEGDIVAFLVVRIFGVGIYSSVMGLLTAGISVATSLGAAFLGYTLMRTGDYTFFLQFSAAAVFVGSILFLLLPVVSRPAKEPAVAETE